MYIEFRHNVVDIPGILIVDKNPITIGAWSILRKQFVSWIHPLRYTSEILTKRGQECSFSIISDLETIQKYGKESGRDGNKLDSFSYSWLMGHKYILPKDFQYSLLLKFEYKELIGDFYMCMFHIERRISDIGVEGWKIVSV